MKGRTLLNTLVTRRPYYMDLLMKSHGYEEMFSMNKKWIGILEFTKKTGTEDDLYHKCISSVITIQDEYAIYQERIDYFLVHSMNTPIIVHPTWEKNNENISSKEIPSTIFKLLGTKHPSNMIYSSHPLSIIQYEHYF
jgi:hypothetical protein